MNTPLRLTLLGLAVALAAAGNANAYMVRQTEQVENAHCMTIAYQCNACSHYWSQATGITPVHVCEREGEWNEDYYCAVQAGLWCLWFEDPPMPPAP